MQFEWDRRKAATNFRKHGVRFDLALTVFSDATAAIFSDPDHSDFEHRELIIGFDASGQLLVVSFVERAKRIRVISARRATPHERHRHEENVR